MNVNASVALPFLSLLVAAACTRAEPPSTRPGVVHLPESAATPPPRTPAEQEVRTALANHAAAVEACRSTPRAVECFPMLQAPSPCDRPRPPYVASFIGLRPEALGAYYFDGHRCYQATEIEPGTCAMGGACHAWTTLAACEAARTICAGDGS